MSMFWLGGLGLIVLALTVVLLPSYLSHRKRHATESKSGEASGEEQEQNLVKPSQQGAPSRQDANVALYREHEQEIKAALDCGSIDETQYRELVAEAQGSLLEDAADKATNKTVSEKGLWILPTLGLLLPLLSLGLYWSRSAIPDLEIHELSRIKQSQDLVAFREGRMPDSEPAKALISKLERRLESKPENVQNWYLLARTATDIEEFSIASNAYREILKYQINSDQPPSPQITAELAQTLFLKEGNKITAEVSALIAQTLELESQNQTALGLAGIEAFQSNQYNKAIDFWQRAIAQLPSESSGARALASGIERAKNELKALGQAPSVVEKVVTGKAASGKGAQSEADQKDKIVQSLTVSVALGSAAKVEAENTVFVYARAWQGPKMPLAITRFPASELPKQVVLSEAMSMTPGMNIKSFEQLELVARVSKSGAATAQRGDWQATLGPVTLKDGKEPYSLVIDSQIP